MATIDHVLGLRQR